MDRPFPNPSKLFGKSCFGLVCGFLGYCSAWGAPPWTYSGSGAWTPPSAHVGSLYTRGTTFQMDAVVSESPAQITLRFFSGPSGYSYDIDLTGTYNIYRKNPDSSDWGTSIGTITMAANEVKTWTDTNVVAGQMYEYIVAPSGSPYKEHGSVVAGIKADRTLSKGRIAVVVAEDIPARLPLEYAQYKADLVADGWVVHEISTPRAKDTNSNNTGTNLLATVTVVSGGTGYTTGQTVVFSNAGGATAVGTISAASGPITSVTIQHSAPGFTVGEALTFTGNSTGSGASLTVKTVTSATAEHTNIRNQLIALYNAFPGELKNVVLLGKVAVARSGIGNMYADGHGNKAAFGADAYYADMDGVWTDTKTNAYNVGLGVPVTGFVNNPDNSVTFPPEVKFSNPSNVQSLVKYYRGNGNYFVYTVDQSYNNGPWQGGYSMTFSGGNMTAMTGLADPNVTASGGSLNIPGDGKFDAEFLSEITPNDSLELGFGRVDFSNNVPGEYEAMRMYFNKLHRYKTASPDFLPGRRALSRAGFGMVTRNLLGSIPGVVGMDKIDWIRDTDLPAVSDSNFDADAAYTVQNQPYLFYFKGSGGPGYSDGGRAVIWTGMQSHWGYWFSVGVTSSYNAMQRRLAEDNFALSYTWSIGLNQNYFAAYLYHRMGMGYDAGDMMRVTLSNRTGSDATYKTDNSPLFMNHMGCPSLRLFMFPPPTDLSVVPSGGKPSLTWTASRAPAAGEPQVIGYHVYRSANAGGPFDRITSTPVAGTAYLDNSVSSGTWHYQVKAVRLETTGGGTYYNTSLGAQQSIDLTNPPAALAVATTTLPDANWNTGYQAALSATGGAPVYTWTVASGSLPPGLALSTSGMVTGSATAAGTYAFTVQVADQLGQTAQKALLLTTQSNNVTTFYAEANSYCSGNGTTTTKWGFGEPSLLMAGPTYLYQPFLRFDISSLAAKNAFVRAKLILTLDERSQVDSYALTRAALTQDAGDGWLESFAWADRPLDDTTVPETYATSFPVAYGTIEIDVTPQVRATLANDAAQKVGLRLYTTRTSGFGSEVRFATRYAPGNARPRLVIETTDAPAINITSPVANPAAIHVGSSLVISATATAIPAQAGALNVQWSKVSGPGTVTFGTPTQASTTAAFSAAGDYVLRLTANDGLLTSTKDLAVRVWSIPAGTTPVSGPALDSSLILRLPFDENAGTSTADVVGARTATLSGLSSGNPTWVASGKIGAALNFLGTGQRVEVEDSGAVPLDGMQKLTASLWVKMTAADASNHGILVKQDTTSANTMSYAITLTSAEKISVSVANKTAVVSDKILNADQWYHVVMIYDGSQSTNNLQLYLDGNPEKFGTIATTGNIVPRITTSRLRVGDYAPTAVTASFNGQVDEVRLYNRVLTIDEIQELATAGPANMGPKIALTSSSVSGPVGTQLALGATVTDDGLPGAVTLGWSKAGGPGSVVFSNPVSSTTNATTSTAGSYALRITANDGSVTTFADVAASFEASGGIDNWRLLHFGTTENSGEAADGANPKKDGLSNLLKYVLGLDPNVDYRGSALAPKGQLENLGADERLTFTFTRDTAVTDATLSVEVVNDLNGTWTTIDPLNPANQVEVLENTPSAGIQTITVKDTQPVTSATKRFMRLKVTRP